MSELRLESDDQRSSNRLVAILCLGFAQAVRHGAITLDEAGHQLLWPWAHKVVQQAGCSPEVLDLLHSGSELEDIESLLPQKFAAALERFEGEALSILSGDVMPYHERPRWLQNPSD